MNTKNLGILLLILVVAIGVWYMIAHDTDSDDFMMGDDATMTGADSMMDSDSDDTLMEQNSTMEADTVMDDSSNGDAVDGGVMIGGDAMMESTAMDQ